MKSSVKNKTKKEEKISSKKNVSVDVVLKSKKKKDILKVVVVHKKQYGKNLMRKMLLSKTFYLVFKIVVGVVLTALIGYGFSLYLTKSLANGVVVSKSEIVDRVAKLTQLPSGDPDAVVRVEDPETLKKQNIFYENAKNGDYILMYPKQAVIYDLRNNIIVAIKKSE